MLASPSFAHLVKSQKCVLEMLVMIATMVKHFEFSLPADDGKTQTRSRIYRKPTVIIMPMVEGEIGAWMGLVHQTYPLTRHISLGVAVNPSAMRPQSLTLMLFRGPEAPTAKLSWFP